MDIERALETQRHALLRLLAGLVMAVGFVSRGPFEEALPRWVQSIAHSILRRAEEAAQCLVTVSAWILANNGATVSGSVERCAAPAKNANDEAPRRVNCGDEKTSETSPDDLLSSDSLRQRMQALQDMLEDLPRHALRLIRKRARQRMANRPTTMLSNFWARGAVDIAGIIQPIQLLAPRIERPPDKRDRTITA